MNMRLWYDKPAADWLEGLPIGTGRLAAMVLGTFKRERLALNHEWLWTGRNRQRDNEPRAHLLPKVRELLLAGRYEEGTQASNDAFGGLGGMSGLPDRVDPYQPAGDLFIEFNHGVVHNYRRTLDLKAGTATVTYEADGKRFTRQYVAHLKEDLLLVRLDAGGKPFDSVLWLDRIYDPNCELQTAATDNSLTLTGVIRDGLRFVVQAQVWPSGGTAHVSADRMVLTGVDAVLVALDIGTSAQHANPGDECAARRLKTTEWGTLIRRHAREHQRHYGGLELQLPFAERDLPTDERIRRVKAGAADPGLALLYFNFGRYLLCASSANGKLPANLQGKWNEDLNPPWESDYHLDVNLQMNYWCAEAGRLQAYMDAFFTYIENFVPHARKAAHDLYGCEGVWFPLQTDPWGRATPESYGWAVWTGAAAWLAQHLWWHYEYGLDRDFLRRRAYPFLKEVAAFYESYLVADAAGTLQFVPSQSPENRFTLSGTRYPVSLCVSATMDIELATDTLTHAIAAAELLNVDADRRARWQDLLRRLPSLKIGSEGQLLEWNEEFTEVEPGHRHLSHLVGLYPGDLLTPQDTPDLFRAGIRSLELRLANAGGHTGWSRAWMACCFARAGDGNRAFEHLEHLITDFATSALLDLHPPRIFQIDGNLGGVAAVLEMLLQSYRERLHLLPALPAAWPDGKVTGLRARGGFDVDIEWAGGRLVQAAITAHHDRPCRLLAAPGTLAVRNADGHPLPLRPEGPCLAFDARAGQTYTVRPAPGQGRRSAGMGARNIRAKESAAGVEADPTALVK